MNRQFVTPWLAVSLAAVTVALPAVAWWLTGQAELERQVERLESDARAGLTDRAEGLASRLVGRLQALRAAESVRPFYEYAARYHDADSGQLVSSPLAGGHEDPLILAHFQVSPDGRLTFPASPEGELGAELEAHVTELATAAAEMRHARKPERDAVVVGALRWRDARLGKTALLASRAVLRSEGTWVQGFLIDLRAAEDFLSTAQHAVRVRAGRPVQHGQASLGLSGLSWRVLVDDASIRESTAVQARWLRSDFLKTYLLGVGLGLVSAVALVALAWQAHGLARQRSTFAAVAAHELRTPLAGLRLHADLIAEGLGDPERAALHARRIASEADRLGRVVRNVLEFSRLERGQLALTPEPGDLGDLAAQVVEGMRPGAEAAGAALELVRPREPLRALFDADAVIGILQNLIDNAVKYSRSAEDRRILVELSSGDDEVSVTVRDHGPGLPNRSPRQLFRWFARGGRDERTAGLGLGLALSTRLATEQGGRLDIDQVECGASLSLRLPAA